MPATNTAAQDDIRARSCLYSAKAALETTTSRQVRQSRSISAAPGSDNLTRRQHERNKAGWLATCLTTNGFSWDCWVVDHSNGGLGLDHCPVLNIDEIIEVSLNDIGKFQCRVAWSDQRRCGVEILPHASHASTEATALLVSMIDPADHAQRMPLGELQPISKTQRSWLSSWWTGSNA